MLTCIFVQVSYFSSRGSCSLWTNGSASGVGAFLTLNSVAVFLKVREVLIKNIDLWPPLQGMGKV